MRSRAGMLMWRGRDYKRGKVDISNPKLGRMVEVDAFRCLASQARLMETDTSLFSHVSL